MKNGISMIAHKLNVIMQNLDHRGVLHVERGDLLRGHLGRHRREEPRKRNEGHQQDRAEQRRDPEADPLGSNIHAWQGSRSATRAATVCAAITQTSCVTLVSVVTMSPDLSVVERMF